jgi:uncharacterized alpha-E superfamily protein
MATVDRLTVQIRDIVHAASEGDPERWVSCRDIQRRMGVTDGAACQAALRRAADEGWLATSGGRHIERVRITAEGIRVCRRALTRSRQR